MLTQPAAVSASPISTQPSQRLLSLDVLRGLTVALMVLVNNAGNGKASYAQLRHSVWNGCT
jgi:predicted acyltransferase